MQVTDAGHRYTCNQHENNPSHAVPPSNMRTLNQCVIMAVLVISLPAEVI